MIKKIVYSIRFPFGASFNKPVQYLFIKNIYREIKQKTCINEEPKCFKCNHKESCIYYKLSGNDFKDYPSILISKDFIEKLHFNANKNLILTFFIIGDSSKYSNFIYEYLDNYRKINGIYFQKVKLGEFSLNEVELLSEKVRLITPINKKIDIEELNKMIHFYNLNYNTSFNKISIFKEVKTQHVFDESKYRINGKIIKLSGNIGVYDVVDYPKVLLEIGITQNNILGSGKGITSTIK